MLNSSTSGATSQTAANSNGSSTTTIDYSDGSSISLTSAPGSSTSSSATSSGSGTSDNSSTAGASNVFGSNLLEQLIRMQAQLLNATPPRASRPLNLHQNSLPALIVAGKSEGMGSRPAKRSARGLGLPGLFVRPYSSRRRAVTGRNSGGRRGA